MNFNFENKVVIVTGASSGIGAATAKMFAQHRAKLCLVGRNALRLQDVAQQCEVLSGSAALCILCDLTHSGSCEDVINKTVGKFKGIDILINCAGKIQVASIYDPNIEIFDELIAINVRVPYYLTQLALPHLKKTKGNVVNIGSCFMDYYTPGFLAYVISKTALEKFSQFSSIEVVAEGVKINLISPGITRTNYLQNFNIDEGDLEIAYNNLSVELTTKNIIDSNAVAKLILLAASNLMPNMAGAKLKIDGATLT